MYCCEDLIKMGKKILILIGPSLNTLGVKNDNMDVPKTLEAVRQQIVSYSKELGLICDLYQSNDELKLVDKILESNDNIDGGIIDPGALLYYSYPLRNAISNIRVPFVEVHMSNVYSKEPFKQKSIIADVCMGQISGFGKRSYLLGILALKDII